MHVEAQPVSQSVGDDFLMRRRCDAHARRSCVMCGSSGCSPSTDSTLYQLCREHVSTIGGHRSLWNESVRLKSAFIRRTGSGSVLIGQPPGTLVSDSSCQEVFLQPPSAASRPLKQAVLTCFLQLFMTSPLQAFPVSPALRCPSMLTVVHQEA